MVSPPTLQTGGQTEGQLITALPRSATLRTVKSKGDVFRQSFQQFVGNWYNLGLSIKLQTWKNLTRRWEESVEFSPWGAAGWAEWAMVVAVLWGYGHIQSIIF